VVEREEMLRAVRDAAVYLRWLQTLGQPLSAGPVRMIDVNAEVNTLEAKKLAKDIGTKQQAGALLISSTAGAADPGTGRYGELHQVVQACRKCPLGHGRTQAVFGHGNTSADLMFIGEAPGANEDKTGLPFVGQAGKVLNTELEKNGIARDEVFICNIIKCRPPDNRDPTPDEIAACEPYLHEQIELIKPKMLCGLGRYACTVLMGEQIKIMKIRGTWSQYRRLPLFVCLHPSAVLHQPNNRQLFNDDIAALAKAYHARVTQEKV
jgi:DNA polymerase